jgi:hypothetical protein
MDTVRPAERGVHRQQRRDLRRRLADRGQSRLHPRSVELDDAPGALLAGNLLEAPYTEAKVGRRVEVVFDKLNHDITLPQFRLARTTPAG